MCVRLCLHISLYIGQPLQEQDNIKLNPCDRPWAKVFMCASWRLVFGISVLQIAFSHLIETPVMSSHVCIDLQDMGRGHVHHQSLT